ncbi:hypothetical protein [Streptomyces fractus]|uniref:hypothetical protein n=1 Tax=Streptomyces fractus TaxID=641806 RepID=UPI003CE7C444
MADVAFKYFDELATRITEVDTSLKDFQGVWIRHQMNDELFEFGFADGSWATLHLPAHEPFTTQVSGILPAGAARP